MLDELEILEFIVRIIRKLEEFLIRNEKSKKLRKNAVSIINLVYLYSPHESQPSILVTSVRLALSSEANPMIPPCKQNNINAGRYTLSNVIIPTD